MIKVHLFLGRQVIKIKSQGPSLTRQARGHQEAVHGTYSHIHRAAHCPGRVPQHLVVAQEVNERRLSDTCKCTEREQLLGGGARVTGGEARSSTE